MRWDLPIVVISKPWRLLLQQHQRNPPFCQTYSLLVQSKRALSWQRSDKWKRLQWSKRSDDWLQSSSFENCSYQLNDLNLAIEFDLLEWFDSFSIFKSIPSSLSVSCACSNLLSYHIWLNWVWVQLCRGSERTVGASTYCFVLKTCQSCVGRYASRIYQRR